MVKILHKKALLRMVVHAAPPGIPGGDFRRLEGRQIFIFYPKSLPYMIAVAGVKLFAPAAALSESSR